MPVDTRTLVGELIATLGRAQLARRGGLGVFIENMPALEVSALLAGLADPIRPLRVALLGGGSSKVKALKGLEVTQDPAIANEWRNAADARSTPAVVVVLGPAPKLNSLRSALTTIGPDDLREALVARAIERLASPERSTLWRALGASAAVPLDALLAFYEAGRARSDAALLELEPTQVHLLGLLQSDGFASGGAPQKMRAALRRNLDLVDRLRQLSAKDRRALASEAGDAEVKAQILDFWKSKSFDDLKGLSDAAVLAALKVESKKPTAATKKTVAEGDALALEMLLEDSRGLIAAAKRFAAEVEPNEEGGIEAEEISVGQRTVMPRVRPGTAQAASAIAGGLCSETAWGGLIFAEQTADIVSALRLAAAADTDTQPFEPAAEGGVRDLLARAAKSGFAPPEALKAWDEYASIRARVLPFAVPLADHPLLALAGNQVLRENAQSLLRAHAAALAGVQRTAEALKDASPDASKRLRARALCADIVFVKLKGETAALAAPTHPFHLWRWLTLHQLIVDNREELSSLGLDTLEPLVSDPPTVAPHIVLSTFALDQPLDKTRSLVAAGSLGALPLFAEPSSRQAMRFRTRALAHIAERLLRVMPHASLGLRILLVDPPSVAGALESLLELKSTLDGETRVPLHVTVARSRSAGESTDEEEVTLEMLARELQETRGSLVVAPPARSLRDIAAGAMVSAAHLCAVFDPGDSNAVKLGVSLPPILSPLMLPRNYVYDAFDDRLDVVVAGAAVEFESYQQLFCELTDTPRSDFLGRRSGASRLGRELEQLALGSVWLTVIDQGLEPTLSVGGANRIDARADGGRDFLTFTAHTEVVEDLVADAIRQVGLRPNEETVKRTLRELLGLSGEALLWLARQKVSLDSADPRIAKGLLGVLAAVRWYSSLHPDALVVSLDDPGSRRWILGAGLDDRHGDLLFLRPGQKGVVVEVVEVKAYDEDAAVVTVSGGVISGRAVTQTDQTITVLRRILSPTPQSMVDEARRAVLRDQLYRAVAGRPYDRDRRKRFVNLLEALFRDGAAEMEGLVVKVQLESGGAKRAPSAAKYETSPAGFRVGFAELVETEVGGGASPASPPTPSAQPPAATAARRGAAPPARRPPERVDAQPPVPTPTLSLPAAEPRVAVHIGTAADGTDVSWEPGRLPNPLNNFGVLITGDAGSGKSQIIRAIVAELAGAGIPICIFDFKNDYTDPAFSGPLGFTVHDVNAKGLPFNPLALIGDKDGVAQPIRLIHEVVGILKRIFKLGQQQEARLRHGVQAAFEQRGIDPKARSKVSTLPDGPSFADVVEQLRGEKGNEALLNRLSPLFDLDLFPSTEQGAVSFEQLMSERVVMDLHALPNDEIKAALAEFIIVRLHGYVLKGDQPRKLRRMLILDEAWRVGQSERLQELAREGRAFGVGMTIGTQFPGDVPDTLAGSLATQLLLQNVSLEHRKIVVKTLVGSTSGPEAQRLMQRIDHLKQHEGYYRSPHYPPYVLVETLPHYKRVAAPASSA